MFAHLFFSHTKSFENYSDARDQPTKMDVDCRKVNRFIRRSHKEEKMLVKNKTNLIPFYQQLVSLKSMCNYVNSVCTNLIPSLTKTPKQRVPTIIPTRSHRNCPVTVRSASNHPVPSQQFPISIPIPLPPNCSHSPTHKIQINQNSSISCQGLSQSALTRAPLSFPPSKATSTNQTSSLPSSVQYPSRLSSIPTHISGRRVRYNLKRAKKSRDRLKDELLDQRRVDREKDRKISSLDDKLSTISRKLTSTTDQLIATKQSLNLSKMSERCLRKRLRESEEDLVMSSSVPLINGGSILKMKENGEYTPKTKRACVELKKLGISDSNIGPVISKVLQNMTGASLSDTPSASTVARASYAANALARLHSLSVLTDQVTSRQSDGHHGMSLLSDETRKWTHPLQTYSMYVQTGDGAVKNQILGLREVVSKDADTSLSTVLRLLEEIGRSRDASDVHGAVASEFRDLVISYTNSAVGDRASTQVRFANLFADYRKQILPKIRQGWTQMTQRERYIHRLFISVPCFVHIISSLAEPVLVEMTKQEFLITKSTDAEEGRSGALVFLKLMTKHFGNRSSGMYSTYRQYLAYCDIRGIEPKSLPSLKGNRFNVIPAAAARVIAYKDHYLEFFEFHPTEHSIEMVKGLKDDLIMGQVQVLAFIDIYLSGPVWRMSKMGSMHVMETTQLVKSLLTWVDERVANPQLLFSGNPPDLSSVPVCANPYRMSQELAVAVTSVRSTDVSIETARISMRAVDSFLRRVFHPFLPGGKYHNLFIFKGLTADQARSSLAATPCNNVASEATFGLADYLLNLAPNKCIARIEGEVLLRMNNPLEWLNSFPEWEQEKIFRECIDLGKAIQKESRQDRRELVENVYERMQRESRKSGKKMAHLRNQTEMLIDELHANSGFLETLDDLEQFINNRADDEKACKALVIQLKVRRSILNQKYSGQKCFTTKVRGRELALDELVDKVRSAIENDPKIELSRFCNRISSDMLGQYMYVHKNVGYRFQLLSCRSAGRKKPPYALIKYLCGTHKKMVFPESMFLKSFEDGEFLRLGVVDDESEEMEMDDGA